MNIKAFLHLAPGFCAALIAGQAAAGGFALKEGSAAAQGASFAGATASAEDITYAFFNPAALRSVEGLTVGFSSSVILPSAEATASTGPVDGGETAFVGATYLGYRVDEQTVLGLSVTAPFGLATEYPTGWAGQYDAKRSDLRTIVITPMLSYEVTPDFAIGVGFSALYGSLVFENAQLGIGNFELSGDGWTYGFSAGFQWDVTPYATLGVAFKSGYNLTGEGEIETGVGTFSDAKANADLPPVLSIGLRAGLTEDTDLLLEGQWQGWSSFSDLHITSPSFVGGGLDVYSPFDYEDAFYFAAGLEHDATDRLTLRTGVAWDGTPTIDETRSPRIPDEDRIWLSAGASYQLTDAFKLDFAYSYLRTLQDPVTRIDTNSSLVPGGAETVDFEGQVHIISLGGSVEF